jgi:hypothetical protein
MEGRQEIYDLRAITDGARWKGVLEVKAEHRRGRRSRPAASRTAHPLGESRPKE